ncbi:hypothetical protein PSP31121_05253 [Pandoraea sputorum]|uniref:Uncharacterized protein n=1 Tax=Pandoraea sputorum TaxID=93222 RepID=A0A5E5BJH6_9BURK|nr:hypothetical protein PSP31121_05253 [Pandoraea sputorum]
MKAASSRATAPTAPMATCAVFPLATRLRYRLHRLSGVSQARSMMGLRSISSVLVKPGLPSLVPLTFSS